MIYSIQIASIMTADVLMKYNSFLIGPQINNNKDILFVYNKFTFSHIGYCRIDKV